jgi:colicin import membrane protein
MPQRLTCRRLPMVPYREGGSATCGRALESVTLDAQRRTLIAPRMPRNPKYPLEPLREHRDRKVDAAALQLGEAVRAREGADAARMRAEQQSREAERRAAAVRLDEAERLAKGELCVADLARAQAWEHAASAEALELGRAVDRAVGLLAASRDAEEQARAELAQKKADLDVVAKDEARFDAEARRAREGAEEEAAEEAFAARRNA